MGIFDDAIREHLDLKRQLGADEEELKELEDEAFGPPERPGDSEFAGGETTEVPFDADEASPAPASGAVEEPEPAPPVAEVGEPEAAADPEATIEAPVPDLPEIAAPAEEPSTGEQTIFEPDSESDELAESPFTTAEREAIADQPTVFFDQAEPGEFDFGELELDIDEEVEDVGGSVEEPLTGEDPLADDESLTGEEPVAEVVEADPPHEVEPEPVTPAEPEPEPEPEPEVAAAPETEPGPDTELVPEAADDAAPGEEDVLEETPEFLRDNPDDDELWFEQGEPKDFDF